MILFGSGTGVLIEAWKVKHLLQRCLLMFTDNCVDHESRGYQIGSFTRGCAVTVQARHQRYNHRLHQFTPPSNCIVQDKHVLSEDEKKTQE